MNLSPLLNGLIRALRRLPCEAQLNLLASKAHDAHEEIQQTRLIIEGTGRVQIEEALLNAEAAFLTVAEEIESLSKASTESNHEQRGTDIRSNPT